MTIDTYLLVSEAIRRADTLEELGAPGAADAHLDVSLLEERIASGMPASDPEGALARRGAIRAAGAANDWRRARELARRFLAEDDAGVELREQIETLLAEHPDARLSPVAEEQARAIAEDRGSSVRVRRGASVSMLIREDGRSSRAHPRLRCSPQDAVAGWRVLGGAPVERERPGSAEHRYLDDLIKRPWGFEHRVYDDALVDVWVQTLAAGSRTPLHCHARKDTLVLCLEGEGEATTGEGRGISLASGHALHIEQGAAHSLAASTDMIVVEVETPRDKFDLVRLVDESGRARRAYEGGDSIRRHLEPLEPVQDGPPNARLRPTSAGARYRFTLERGRDLHHSPRGVMFAISLDPLGILRRDIEIADPATLEDAVAEQLYLTIRRTGTD